MREDGPGSVSAHLVVQVSVVDRLPTDPKLCDMESAGRLRTPLQTSSSKGTSGRGGCEPGRLRPPYPPGLSRSCIALEHAQGHGVRSEQNVGTRGSGDPGAGARGKGGHRVSIRNKTVESIRIVIEFRDKSRNSTVRVWGSGE